MLVRYSIPLTAFLLAAGLLPRLPDGGSVAVQLEWPQPEPSTFIDRWNAQLAETRALHTTLRAAAARVGDARGAAVAYQALPRDAAVLDEAARRARETRFEAALEIAERVNEVPQPREIARRAHDIAAFSADQLGLHEDVVLHLTTGTEIDDVLSPYRDFWLARAALAVGRPELARDAALRARAGAPRDVLAHASAFIASEALLEMPGHEREGIRDLERLLERYPEYPRYDRLQLRMAAADLRAGHPQSAADRLDAHLWARPFHSRAAEAQGLLDTLIAEGVRVRSRTFDQRLERGRQVRLQRHWDVARSLLEATLADAIADGQARDLLNKLRFQLALTAYDSADFEGSIGWLDAIADAGNVGISSYDLHTWRARSLSRLGREDEAYAHLDGYYRQRSWRARHRAMFEFASDLGLWDRAIEHLDALYDDDDWETFDGAFAWYFAGHYERAERLFAEVSGRTSGRTRSRARYWQARSLANIGRYDEAVALYARVAANYPTRYYGLQSMNRSAEIEAARGDHPGDAPTEVETGPGRLHWGGLGSEANATLRSVVGAERRRVFTPYPAELSAEGELAAFAAAWGEIFPASLPAAALIDIGALEPARLRFREVLVEFRALDRLFERGRRVSSSRPIRLDIPLWGHLIDNRGDERGYWGIDLDERAFPVPTRGAARRALVARQSSIRDMREALRPTLRAVARELGDHYVVRRMLLEDDLRREPLPEAGPASTLWQEAYPHAYGHFVRRSAELYDLNPYLLWALMIVESDMNPDTVSHADAYGLMQVIPKTGELVAQRFGDIDFGIYDLMQPSTAMRFGAYYINELLVKFHGQELLAMIAYNAGPHQVARWLQWRGDGMALDEFIETVPYDGARRYPQRILRYVAMYRRVYGLGDTLYVGNELDATFEDNIYF